MPRPQRWWAWPFCALGLLQAKALLTYNYGQYGNMTCVQNHNTHGYCPQYSYNGASNQISTSGYTYDADGNLLTDNNGNQYQWDAEGRMVYWSNAGNWQSMLYNALGQRVAETMPDGTYNRTLIYPRDIFGHRTEVFDYRPSWNWVGADQWWARVAGVRLLMGGSTSQVRHADALGSTTMVTDQAGNVDGDIVYDPWGNAMAGGGSNGDVFADLSYQVNYPVPPSATRDYNPTFGRWLVPDPDNAGATVSNPQSWNMYAYVDDSPTTFNDPLGLYMYGDDSPDPLALLWYEELVRDQYLNTVSALKSLLINAQNWAMHNPDYMPQPIPGTTRFRTFCNIATCDVLRAVGAPMGPFLGPDGRPLPADIARANLAKPDSGWKEVSARQAQILADEGKIVVVVGPDHESTVRPRSAIGPSTIGKLPYIANVGQSSGVMGINYVFRRAAMGEVKFYTPEH